MSGGGFILSKAASIDAVTGCPPAEAVAAGYYNPFRQDPVSKGIWSAEGRWIDVPAPLVSQGATPSFTVLYAAYRRIDTSVRYQGSVSITGTPGTASNAVIIGLPPGITSWRWVAGSLRNIGAGIIFDSSASAYYKGLAVLISATTIGLLYTAGTTANYLGVLDFTAAVATSDTISWDVEAEVVP